MLQTTNSFARSVPVMWLIASHTWVAIAKQASCSSPSCHIVSPHQQFPLNVICTTRPISIKILRKITSIASNPSYNLSSCDMVKINWSVLRHGPIQGANFSFDCLTPYFEVSGYLLSGRRQFCSKLQSNTGQKTERKRYDFVLQFPNFLICKVPITPKVGPW